MPGERVAAYLFTVAMAVASLAVLAAGFIVWGWLIKLIVEHMGSGVAGLLEWCVVAFMGAVAASTLAGGAWATLQAPAVRRALGRPPRGMDATRGSNPTPTLP